MKLCDFDYEFPRELIAQYPAERRDLSRLLVLNRGKGTFLHKSFKDFPDYIKPEDILVLNNTKVINARLFGKRVTGGKVEIFLLENLGDDRFRALVRSSRRIKEGEEISFANSKLKARVFTKDGIESIIQFSSPLNNITKELSEAGEVPLPPYVRRKPELLDEERYQTVYAQKEGATASPTAGLHFTKEILAALKSKGVKLAHVTLHVNYGTFAPVKTEDITNHKMHSEDFELTEEAAAKINDAKEKGGQVFAVGTTSCRVLETCAKEDGRVKAGRGKTNLFIYPPHRFKMVDALLTNFHFPKSTLLMLVSAFAGRDLIFKAYREAIAEKYRFFSYGDAMLIIGTSQKTHDV